MSALPRNARGRLTPKKYKISADKSREMEVLRTGWPWVKWSMRPHLGQLNPPFVPGRTRSSSVSIDFSQSGQQSVTSTSSHPHRTAWVPHPSLLPLRAFHIRRLARRDYTTRTVPSEVIYVTLLWVHRASPVCEGWEEFDLLSLSPLDFRSLSFAYFRFRRCHSSAESWRSNLKCLRAAPRCNRSFGYATVTAEL